MEINQKKLLKMYIDSQEYKKCVKILEEEITKILLQKIKKIDNEYEYSTLFELLEKAESSLDEIDVIIYREFYLLENSEMDSNLKTEELLNLYEGLI